MMKPIQGESIRMARFQAPMLPLAATSLQACRRELPLGGHPV